MFEVGFDSQAGSKVDRLPGVLRQTVALTHPGGRRWLARIFHELPTTTVDMVVLPGVLGCRALRRTVQVCLGPNTLRLPGGTAIFTVSRRQFMEHAG